MPDEQLDKVKALMVEGDKLAPNYTFLGPSTDISLFARIVRGELPQWRVWEGEHSVAFLTPFPSTEGFTVVVPRSHLSSDILNNNNDEWLTCEKDRVFMYRKMGKLKIALEMASQNFENQVKVRGATHLGTLASQRCLGAIQKDLGMNTEAEQNLRATLEVLERTEKPDSYHIQVTKYQLAEAIRNLGRLEEAMEMYQELIDIKTESSRYGRRHSSTQNCVLMKARCISLSGHPECALSHYNEALPVLRKDWGSNDPSVIKGAQWMEEARRQCAEAFGGGWA